MKRTLGAVFGIFVFFEAVIGLSAATYQAHNLGTVRLILSSATVAVINASTAPAVGDMRFCYNCGGGGGGGTICISTSIAAPGAGSDYVLSTGTQCK